MRLGNLIICYLPAQQIKRYHSVISILLSVLAGNEKGNLFVKIQLKQMGSCIYPKHGNWPIVHKIWKAVVMLTAVIIIIH